MFALLGNEPARPPQSTEGAPYNASQHQQPKRLDPQHPAAHLLSEERLSGGRDALDEFIYRRHSKGQRRAADSVRTQDAMVTNMRLLKQDAVAGAQRAPLPPSSRVLALAKPQHVVLPPARSAPAWSYGVLGAPRW